VKGEWNYLTQLEKGKISGSQLVYLIVGYIIGSSVILPPGGAAKQDAWLAIVIGAVEGGIFALIFTTLARRFPGESIVEILETVFGPYLGKLIAVSFLWYSFHLGSIVIRDFTDFFTTAIMPETPSIVFAALLVLVSAFAVFNGLEVITRCSLVLVPLTVFFLVITFLLQVNQLDFNNFLPLFETPIWQLLKISNTVAAFPFGETVTFLMVLPFLNQTNEGRSKTIIGILWAALFIMLASWRSIGALGATGYIFSYPAFEAVKLINLPFVSMRLEIIIVINFLMMGFLKITALHYSTVLGLGQIFKLRSIRPLIVPIGILMVIFSIINYSGFLENVEFTYQVYHIYALPFQLGMPLLTLIVAAIRKLPQRSTE
jgi:spore germination protein KB